MRQSKVTRLVVALVAALVIAVGSAAAQDYFSPLFAAYTDHMVQGPSPCGAVRIQSISPHNYDQTMMLFYLCEDGRVIARRFFRVGDTSQAPQPVYLVSAPSATASAPEPPPAAPQELPSCPAGLVVGRYGGCVPPDHPYAK
jgi:hypothetical protein